MSKWEAMAMTGWTRSAAVRLASARRLGARRLAEGVHGNREVLHVQDLERFGLRGGAQQDAIARPRFHQRARERRHPADIAPVQIDLVDADDADDVLAAGAVLVGDG